MREEEGGKLIQEICQFVIMTKGVGTYLVREEEGGKLIQESCQFVIMTKGVGTYLEEAAYQGVGA